MPDHLFLVRHGESHGNVASNRAKLGDESLFTDEFVTTPGRQWELTELGRRQAELSGAWLTDELARIGVDGANSRHYVSPFMRTRQTAAFLGLRPGGRSAEWYLNRSLRERDWGDIETIPRRLFSEDPAYARNAAKKEMDPLYWRPPGGESISDVADNRVRNLLDTMHRECSGGTVIAVSHGEFIQATRLVLERVDDDTYTAWQSDPAARIHNAEIVQYSRVDVRERGDNRTQPRLAFVRRIRPHVDAGGMAIGPWHEIVYGRPTNEELLG